ncbi:MAG: Hsp20/alpha crystallin family protein [Patescibacteria group bacterium]|jgi:HSP20 family protein|nr:Hsp20/alpha crystallin family protein [Patescibacteria group bacterium]
MTRLVKWSPFFDGFEDFEELFPALRGEKSGFVPAVDMYQDEKNVVVEVQLAGIDPEDVEISIENDVLIVRGQSEKTSEVDDKNYYKKEIKRGNFYRTIQLPSHVNGDATDAEATDGVLKITIPKTTEVKSKTIKIKTKNKK